MPERKHRQFTSEYTAEAIKYAESGHSLQSVAEELGIHADQLRGWHNESLAAGMHLITLAPPTVGEFGIDFS